MANTKSALKNARKTRARTIRNRPLKSKLKTLEKKFRASVEKENAEEATETAKALSSALDKALKKNLVHRNKVARKKSDCAKAIFGLSETSKPKKAASKAKEEPEEKPESDQGGEE